MIGWYQNIPLYLSPIAFTAGSFSVRWYGISYLVGFGTVWLLLSYQIKKGEANNIFLPRLAEMKTCRNEAGKISNRDTEILKQNMLFDFLLVAFFSALIGGRVGYVLFYNLNYFRSHPWAIISPYEAGNDMLMGIYGMSYHGALIGILISTWIFLKVKKLDFLFWADFVAPAVALGYFFGRLGNFLNGELYGRVTTSSIGMHFLADPTAFRHPSQLYEAFLEGILLFVVLWNLRKCKLPKGGLIAIYLVGYGGLRIFAELFREPDPQVGFIFGFLTMGQILSLLMVLVGAALLFVAKKNSRISS